MLGETEPERRFGHVAVRWKHYILVLGGVFYNSENLADIRPLCANVIWLYNLYTE